MHPKFAAVPVDAVVYPLFHTGHESRESPRIDFLVFQGGFVRFHFFSPIVMFYKSLPIQIRCRYEYLGELAQIGWNRARIRYD